MVKWGRVKSLTMSMMGSPCGQSRRILQEHRSWGRAHFWRLRVQQNDSVHDADGILLCEPCEKGIMPTKLFRYCTHWVWHTIFVMSIGMLCDYFQWVERMIVFLCKCIYTCNTCLNCYTFCMYIPNEFAVWLWTRSVTFDRPFAQWELGHGTRIKDAMTQKSIQGSQHHFIEASSKRSCNSWQGGAAWASFNVGIQRNMMHADAC